jgi:hypothetical protein
MRRLRSPWQQHRSLEHAAEFFFGGVLLLSTTGRRVLHDLVNDGKPVAVHDPDVFLAFLPELVLLDFHCLTVARLEESASSGIACAASIGCVADFR